MVKVGIVGGTGYTGVELLRLLALHPEVEVVAITSRGDAGTPVAAMFPSLRGFYDLKFVDPATADLTQCDVVFFATPNGIAMQQAPALLAAGVRVIDLAADFRIKDVAEWERWYGMTHACPEWVAKAVYGLPELNRDAIRGAQLIANVVRHRAEVTSIRHPRAILRDKAGEARKLAKLYANAYRYIEFAATNHFYMIANSAGTSPRFSASRCRYLATRLLSPETTVN